MATISGRVVFDRDRSATINAGDSGLANVPVVLQNIATGARLVVLTDANGNYSFINVPNGDYRIVQSYGTTGGVPTPGDFSTAVVGPVPVGTNPPISFATDPPPGSTNLDSVTPDTLLVTVTGANLTNENFLDGPVIYTPIQDILDSCVSVSDVNLINVADNGTFGIFPPGTPANTGVPTEPYPGVTPDFTYVLPNPATYTPTDGEYTVQNIMNDAYSNTIGAWWRIADHTTGNETGRMMVVNGFNPGAVFFRDTVSVQPNTDYLFTSWILNLFKVLGYANPQLGVRILDENGNPIYSATLGTEIPVNTNAPEWKEIGTVINSQNNTSLTVEFLSEGPATIGNDYAIDDVSLVQVQIPQFIPVKTVNTPTANVGEVVTYTVDLTNTCSSPLTDVFFQDTVPNGLSFIPGSVIVNGISDTALNPNIGFNIPDVLGGSTTIVTFDAIVDFVPVPNPTSNTATINYAYTPVEGGIPIQFTTVSNEVLLFINEIQSADIGVIKTADLNPIFPGSILTYTIEVTNFGPSDAQDVILNDFLPLQFFGAEFSLDGGFTFNPWPGSYDLGTLLVGETVTILLRGIVERGFGGPIINTAEVKSTTPDPNFDNNTSTVVTDIIELADVAVFKTASPNPVIAGDILTYTIDVTNFGPSLAQNVILNDFISPNEFVGVEFSIDGGITFSPWPGSYDLGILAPGEIRTIIIRGTMLPSATGSITNTAEVTSSIPDPNIDNNTSTVVTEINIVIPEADIGVDKSVDRNPVFAGDVITYTIKVFNFGPADAENVVLNDFLPPNEIIGAEFSTDGGVTFSPWTGSYDIGTLVNGESISIIIRGIVSPSVPGGTIISNTADVTSTTPDPNPSNNTSSVDVFVEALADVSVMKTATPIDVVAGDVVTYTIEVTNFGPSFAQDVTLIDSIPTDIISPEFSIDGGDIFNPWPTVYDLGTLAPGETRIIIIRGTVSPSTINFISNTAEVTSSTPDPDLGNNKSTIDVNVVQLADVSVKKSVSPSPVTPGDTIVYTIQVENAGPSDAQNVVLSDDVPTSIISPEFSTDGGVTFSPWPGNYDIGTLAANEVRTILIIGTVSTSAMEFISNTATVMSTTPDPNLSNNTFTIDVAVVQSADVSVVKTASISPIMPGQILTYAIDVKNAGPSDAQNVVLDDGIPSEIVGPEFSVDGGVTFNPWPTVYDLGTLAAGELRTILIRGTVSSSATGTISNTATVTSTTPDPNPSNNISTVETEINALADVSVVKTASPNSVIPGETLTYTIDVSNAGPADAQNVVLDDAIPPSITGAEFSVDGGVTFNPWPTIYDLGTLLAGETRTILIRGTVVSSATGSITNIANVTSSTLDPNLDNNTSIVDTEVNALADISVIKTVSPNPVSPGEALTYTINVANTGPADAENVVLTDVISPEIIGAEFSTDGGVTFNPWPGTYDLGTLANGETRTILIRGTVSLSAVATISNTAGVISSTPDPNLDNNTSTVDTEINTADISVIKTSDLNPAFPGQVLTYTIEVSNAGPADSQNVVLTDAIPPEIVGGAEFSTDGGVTFSPWTGNYAIGTLPVGETRTILIRGTVTSSASETITNTANVTSTTPDPNLSNNTSTVDTQVNALADIGVVKTGSPNPVFSGETLTYTIDVSNFGPSYAENVTLSDVIPPEITGAEFSTDGGVTFSPWTGSYDIGTLANGETQTILIRGTVAPTTPGFITNTADVTSTTPDPNPSNNTSTSVVEVNESTPVADVGVFKSVEVNPVTAGQMVVYPIRVSNLGPADAANVVLTDAIPSSITGAEFSTDGGITFSPWTGSYTIGTLPAGATVDILIRGTVAPSATGVISNTADVSSTTEDPNPSNNSSTVDVAVEPSADVSVTKTAAPSPVAPGETLTYTINATNAGPSDAQDVTVSDAIPPEITVAEFSIDGGITFSPWTGTYDIGTLPAGETRTILIRGTVLSSATGTITNTANVTSSTSDPNLDNNKSTTATEIDSLADISVVKTASPSPVIPGETLTYTINVSNAGPATAENVVLNDAISPNIIGPEFSIDGGVTFNPWSTIYDIGLLTAGETRTILIRGTVSSIATGSINNTAGVISSTPDPDPGNNESTIITQINALADVSVIKTSNPNPVMPGEVLIYTIYVSNAGPADAQNVVLVDAISPNITAPEFSIDGGVTFNPWPTIYEIGTLPAGETRIILIRGTVPPSATGVITNTANVTSSTEDPNPDNNTSTVDTEINALADISVVKTGSPDIVTPGEILTYTIEVSNAGPAESQNVVLDDGIPPEIINPEFSIDGGVTFNPWINPYYIGTLAAGETRTIIIRGIVSPSATGIISNTAAVTSTTPDPNPDNNISTVDTEIVVVPPVEADVSVVKTASSKPVIPGEMLVYTIVVSNAGPADAENVVLQDNIPSGIKGVEFSVDGGVTFSPWTGSYDIGTLPAGASITILIRGTVSSQSTRCRCIAYITNTAKVTSTTPDPNLVNNTSTIITRVCICNQVCSKCCECKNCKSNCKDK